MVTLATTHAANIAALKADLITEVKKRFQTIELTNPKTGYLKSGEKESGLIQFWNLRKATGSTIDFQIDYQKDSFFFRFQLSFKELFTNNQETK